ERRPRCGRTAFRTANGPQRPGRTRRSSPGAARGRAPPSRLPQRASPKVRCAPTRGSPGWRTGGTPTRPNRPSSRSPGIESDRRPGVPLRSRRGRRRCVGRRSRAVPDEAPHAADAVVDDERAGCNGGDADQRAILRVQVRPEAIGDVDRRRANASAGRAAADDLARVHAYVPRPSAATVTDVTPVYVTSARPEPSTASNTCGGNGPIIFSVPAGTATATSATSRSPSIFSVAATVTVTTEPPPFLTCRNVRAPGANRSPPDVAAA